MKLLSFKPFIIKKSDLTLRPYTLPDFVWPEHTIVQATCENHIQRCSCVEKHIPGVDCNCGICSTLDVPVVMDFINTVQSTEDEIYIMGVVQILGKTIQTGKVLRSEKVFLWGLIGNDNRMFPGLSRATYMEFWLKYHPKMYGVDEMPELCMEIRECWQTYDPAHRKDVPGWWDAKEMTWDDILKAVRPKGPYLGLLQVGDRVMYIGESRLKWVAFSGPATIFAIDNASEAIVDRDVYPSDQDPGWFVHPEDLEKI